MIADAAGVPLYIVHVSCEQAHEAIRRARQKGMRVYGEPLIQHLTLDESEYFNRDWDYAARRVMSPPFRSKEHQASLWAGLQAGSLQVVATDHCAFTTEQKRMGLDGFPTIPNGTGGLEDRMPMLWTDGVETGRLTPSEFVAVTSTNIAKILNVYPRKGAIVEGADADIVVWDPKLPKTISATAQKSIIDYNVFEGREVRGLPRYTLSRGDVVWADGQNSQPQPGRGKFVPRPAFPAAHVALTAWKALTAPRGVRARSDQHSVGRVSRGGAGGDRGARARTCVFATNDGPVQALKDVDLRIGKGDFVSFIGPSGCGKTTFLRVAADLEQPTAGTITVNGMSPAEARAKRAYGYVFQAAGLFPWRTIAGNVGLPLEVMGLRPRRAGRAGGAGAGAGRADRASRRSIPWQLSGGMQQRASIARALAFDADILLMDEPFGALDEIVRDKLNEQLLALWERTGKTIAFVTHSIPEAVYLSTRIVVMSPRPGRVTDVIESPLPRERPLHIRESRDFLEIAARVRDGLRAGIGDEVLSAAPGPARISFRLEIYRAGRGPRQQSGSKTRLAANRPLPGPGRGQRRRFGAGRRRRVSARRERSGAAGATPPRLHGPAGAPARPDAG